MYDILGFPILTLNNKKKKKKKKIFISTFLVIENTSVLFYHSVHICQVIINLYNLTNFYLLT